jgi:uncharacterized protein (TIGR02646 family)
MEVPAMIKVIFPEPDTQEWKAWRKKADDATQELIAKVNKGEKPNINDKLYKGMKQVIFDVFHGKCAYCEAKFILDQSGDVEHFRPKKGVTDENDQTIKDHPGYYWLAYDWCNLLPSCGKCNRLTKTRDGNLVGKGNRFPIKGARATKPDDNLENEQHLFIHPVFDDPDEHFVFDPITGLIGSKDGSERGITCIDLLDLNREGLPEERRDIYLSVVAFMYVVSIAYEKNEMEELIENLGVIITYKKGEKAYSLAGRKALEEDNPHYQKTLKPIADFLGL